MNLGLLYSVIGLVLFLSADERSEPREWNPALFVLRCQTHCLAYLKHRLLGRPPAPGVTHCVTRFWRELVCRVAPRLIVNVEEYPERRHLHQGRWTSYCKVDCDKKFEAGGTSEHYQPKLRFKETQELHHEPHQ